MSDDQATGKMQHGPKRVGPLFPTNQQASIPIEPAMRSLDNPSSCPRTLALGLALVPTTTNPLHHADPPDMLMNPASRIT